MSAMRHPTPEERDERVPLPLDPETALRALLRVDPDAPPIGSAQDDEKRTREIGLSDGDGRQQ